MLARMKKPFLKPSHASKLRAQAEVTAQSATRNSTWTAALGLAANASLWIAVFAGLFFSEGHAYRDAYLFTYGLYPPMFPWDHGDMVYFGVNVGFPNLLTAIFFPSVAASYFIALLISLARRWKRWKRGDRISQAAENSVAKRTAKPLSMIEIAAISFLLIVGAALIFMFIYFVMNKVAAAQGETKAKQEIKRQDSCNITRMGSHDFIPVRVERLVQNLHEHYDGFLITCSTANCGVRSAVTGHVQVVPRDGILRFDTVDIADAYLPRR